MLSRQISGAAPAAVSVAMFITFFAAALLCAPAVRAADGATADAAAAPAAPADSAGGSAQLSTIVVTAQRLNAGALRNRDADRRLDLHHHQ